MLKNYFKTAIRSLLRNRNYTIINIAGLATGIAVCLLIFVIIRFENSFDNFHSKKDRIFRVLSEYHHPGDGVFDGQAVPYPLPTAMKTDFPQLVSTGIYVFRNSQLLIPGVHGETPKKFKEATGVFAVEPTFFKIFDFPWLAGNPATALSDPNSAVLTREMAEKYFGDWKAAMGRSIRLGDKSMLTVTGILAPVPSNTDFQFKVVIPYSLPGYSKSTDWVSTDEDHACYILLPPGMTAASLDAPIRAFSKKYRPADDKDELAIQSLNQVHTYDAHIGNFLGKSVKPEVIRALWLIGAFILLIACVNFINLSTAQAVNRAKEVGVRKVLGSNRRDLKLQFLLETLLIVLGSVVLAGVIISLTMPVISSIVDLPLTATMLYRPEVLGLLLLLTLLVTFLAGFYPSVVLARFSPIEALKSKLAAKSIKGISLRRGLVVFQFIIAQGLIIATLIMVRQMDFFRNSPMGFDKEAIVDIPFPSDSANLTKLDYLRNRLSDLKGIKHLSFSSSGPATEDNNWTPVRFDHAAKVTDFYLINKWADSNYVKTYNLPLVAGSNFHSNDSIVEFLVTEQFVRQLGLTRPEAVINKEIDLWGFLKGPVVGVIKDFHSSSLKDGTAPVLITKFKRGFGMAGMKLAASDIPGTLKAVEKIWGETFPEYVFEYQFLDEKIDNFYKQERHLSDLYKLFAGIAIFLSCLGLYGLASFMAVQRIKEIGIRKVLGASIRDIIVLFSREFIILIGIAFAVAAPLAWYFMHKWLQDYIYRTEISWWIFLLGGVGAVLIALITVSFQAIKAAMTNPVKSLKME